MGWGDDLMWMGEASKVHADHPEAILHDGTAYSELWSEASWIGRPPKGSDYVPPRIEVPRKPGGNRWYVEGWGAGKAHLKPYQPTPAPYTVTSEEFWTARALLKGAGVDTSKPFIIVNPDSKNTTFANNKNWGFDNWQSLVDIISKHITVVRLIPPKSVVDISGLVEYNNPELNNAVNISTSTASIRQVFAINSLATGIVTTEGGLHHLAAALNQRCFVIYGGVISPENTGYRDRNQTYYTYDNPNTPCGSQVDCQHCLKAMHSIKPSAVADDVIGYLNHEQSNIYKG